MTNLTYLLTEKLFNICTVFLSKKIKEGEKDNTARGNGRKI